MFKSERSAKAWNTRHAGKAAFTAQNAYGYFVGSVNGRILQSHRVAWAIVTGENAPHEIDHISGDRSDNRWVNLRAVTAAENRKNMKLPKNNTSGVCGVSVHRPSGKWQAKITVDGRQIPLGLYVSKDEAASVRAAAEKRLGFHPNHGRSS